MEHQPRIRYTRAGSALTLRFDSDPSAPALKRHEAHWSLVAVDVACQALKNNPVLVIALNEDFDINEESLSCDLQTRTVESNTSGKYFLATAEQLSDNDIFELCEHPEFKTSQLWFHPLRSPVDDLDAFQAENILRTIKDVQAGGLNSAVASAIELVGMTSNGQGLYWNSPRSTEPEVLPGIKSSCDENGLQLISA